MKKQVTLARFLIVMGCIGAATILMGMMSKPSQPNALVSEFNQIMQRLPQSGPNSAALRNGLNTVQALLINNQLPIALQVFKDIQASLQNMSFTTEFGPLSGEELIANYFTDFIKNLETQISRPSAPANPPQPSPAGRPFGLVNKKNSCFMNSGIQSLASLERLTQVLLRHANDDFYKPGSLSAAFIQLLTTMQTERTPVINPLQFCLLAWRLFAPEAMGNQQDAPEFVQLLLEALAEKDINRARNPEGKNMNVISLFQIKITERSYDENDDRIFRTNDDTGAIISDDSDHLIVPPITIQSSNRTLLNCLQNIFTIEAHVANENQKKVTALLSVSNYFLVRLRRTSWNKQAGAPFKNEQPISFPLENFDVSSLSIHGKKFPLYRCKAFILHAGVATGGHYTAYVRMGNNWFSCDDTSVSPASIQEVREFADKGSIGNRTPIMFFYEQQ